MKARSQGAFALIAVLALGINGPQDAVPGELRGPQSRSFKVHVANWAQLADHFRTALAILPTKQRKADVKGMIENGSAVIDCNLPLTREVALDFVCAAIFPRRIQAQVLTIDSDIDSTVGKITVDFPLDAIEAMFSVESRWGGRLSMCVSAGIPDEFHLDRFENLDSDKRGRFWFQTGRMESYYGYLIESRAGRFARAARGWFRLGPTDSARAWNPGGRFVRVQLSEQVKSFRIYCDDPFGLPPHPLLQRSVYAGFSEEADEQGSYLVWIAEGTKRVFMTWPQKGQGAASTEIHRPPSVLGAEIRIPFH